MFLRRIVPIALVIGLAVPAEQAFADEPPPADIPAVAAYVEMVPTSRGPKQAGVGTSRPRRLPPRVTELLHASGGDDAAILEQLATSPSYGAPAGSLRGHSTPSGTPPEPVDPPSNGPLTAAISVSADGGEGRLLGLLAALLAATAAIGLLAARRRPRVSN